MDTYYHLLTGWGFIQAGGYSGWDFWQYAPAGRAHIYPPFFHILLALIFKSGLNRIITAKLLETVMPVIVLCVIWNFVKKHYTDRLAFLTLFGVNLSFSFYASLSNYLPASLSIVLGFLALDAFLKEKFLKPSLLLGLCFYTHIGMSWFFFITIMACGLFDQRYRRPGLVICAGALILSIPILWHQFAYLSHISFSEMRNEKYLSEFKPINYLLALIALIKLWRKDKKYRVFLGFLVSSIIFLPYPYRFFSAQGYLPIIFLSGLGLDLLLEGYSCKYPGRLNKSLMLLLLFLFLFFSPTIVLEKGLPDGTRPQNKIFLFDSALTDIMFPLKNHRAASISYWLPSEYLATAKLITGNSQEGDIVYSKFNLVGVALASICGRPTANALLPEILAPQKLSPLLSSKIIIMPKDEAIEKFNLNARKNNLLNIGENKLFIIYKNLSSTSKIDRRKASVSIRMIILILLVFAFLLFQADRIDRFFLKKFRSVP